ncbi:LAMI_0C02080g1_1 [Lachancea mirantina]|uniref:Spindle pole component BBP1 n=1 Tax=Lachancea mirantina TaxID=1230905 RepID=A0A1G4J0X4_9SACH|nr:LAMI_0C02080g1_1 [Lachancea mirantina]
MLSNSETDDNTGGLFRWTMDALFGRRVSPSRKYRTFAQDDTNYNLQRDYRAPEPQWDGEPVRARSRANSLSFDGDFLDRYELLPEEEIMDEEERFLGASRTPRGRNNAKLTEEYDLDAPAGFEDPDARLAAREGPTDTFSKRRSRSKKYVRSGADALRFRPPTMDDPLVSTLLDGQRSRVGRNLVDDDPSLRSTLPTSFPGKFPSPAKERRMPQDHLQDPSAKFPAKDYTNKYMELLQQLDANSQLLKGVRRDFVEKRQAHENRDLMYRNKYLGVRQELINELRQSKRLYDNFYTLYNKYKALRKHVNYSTVPEQRVRDLEAQIVDLTIQKATEERKLNERIFKLELRQQELLSQHEKENLRNESRIAELESLLMRTSPMKNYSSVQDAQYLNTVVPGA